ILVYLDPTAESAERLKFAAGLAKACGARLIGVDIAAATGALAAGEGVVTEKVFEEAAAGLNAVFVPAEKPSEGDAFTHCVDLIVAPAPAGAARDVVRRGALDRALVESGAPMLILPPEAEGRSCLCGLSRGRRVERWRPQNSVLRTAFRSPAVSDLRALMGRGYSKPCWRRDADRKRLSRLL